MISGELTLCEGKMLAVTVILRGHAERHALPLEFVKADVFIEPPPVPDGLRPTPKELLVLTEIAGSSRAGRRSKASSQIDIRVTACSSASQQHRRGGAHARSHG